ncbi:MAG: DPP IV N-terminal domain-containing protein [Acidobacteria bacterium]|nr:DPP IV N-terminal domain-containing protein [Acidobacteriota bacterium]
MKIISLFFLAAAAFVSSTLAQQAALTAADYARAEAMLGNRTAPFVDRNGVRPTFLSDGRFWYRNLTPTGVEYVLIDPSNGSRKVAATMAELGISGTQPTRGGSGRFGSGGGVVSPDGKRTAYIKDFNLWVRDIGTGKETQLTTDGVKNFGYATDNAGWQHSDRAILVWSADSKKIATFQQDERNVNDTYLVTTNVGAPKLQTWKSALPGDATIAMIQPVIIEVDSPKLIRLQTDPLPHRSTACDDVSCGGGWDDAEWSSDGKTLAFVATTRDHKKASLRIADASTGAVREVFEEVSPTQFESTPMGANPNWRYLSGTNEIIWYSERDGWGHLYLFDAATGKIKGQITKGDFAVWEIAKLDETNRVIYFQAGGRELGHDPYFGHLYRINFDGTGLKLLTPEDANHVIAWSDDGKYFVDNFSTPDSPTTAVLKDLQGKQIAVLEKGDVSRLTATGWKPPTRIVVKARDGATDLYGLMFTPSKLDPSKKYPIINNIYPGPQGGSVGNRSFTASRGDSQALAELGFVVVQIDGTCNPLRSKKFHDMCYGNMGDNTLEDQVAGMKQLAAKYPYIDIDRVGIWGHSGGGFATAAAMFKYPDFFKVGIAESGNHDNRNYEDDWGERYIGLLSGDNYAKQANETYAKNLKGHLMLAHGTMDDNVPPYNTFLVVDALIKANKDFDLVIIPNARHGYGQAGSYMMRKRWDYFVRYLLGAEPPKEYEFKTTADPRLTNAR